MAWSSAARLRSAQVRRANASGKAGFTFHKRLDGKVGVGYTSRGGKKMMMAESFGSSRGARTFVRKTQTRAAPSRRSYRVSTKRRGRPPRFI